MQSNTQSSRALRRVMPPGLQPLNRRSMLGLLDTMTSVTASVKTSTSASGIIPEVVASGSPLLRAADTLISCRNSQGLEIRATPLRLTRFSAVFEVYNPFSILQLSEVLTDLRISMGDRTVYAGRAVVSSLVNTGILLVCEVSLEEGWMDIDIFSPFTDANRLREEFEGFLHEWSKIHTVSAEFKAVVADMETLLRDLRRWLEQVEFGIRSMPGRDVEMMEREVLGQLGPAVVPTVNTLFSRFETLAGGLSQAEQPIHRTYMRRQLHPLVLCAPFAYRTFQKPLGYAGDYQMVNMILGEPMQGASLFAKTVNYWFLNQAPAAAHRNRIDYLLDRLREEATRAAALGRRFRVFNLGCGPAHELQRFLDAEPLADLADLHLLDFNAETIEFASERLGEIVRSRHRTTSLAFTQRSVHQILKEAAKGEPPTEQHDLVYCAGLFDYLSDRICQRLMDYLYSLVAPGGLLVSTNVDPSNPLRHGMEYLLEWHLIYRDQRLLRSLHPSRAREDLITTKSDATGVNIYLEVRRPNGP